MFAKFPVLDFSWCIRLYHEKSACGVRSHTMPPQLMEVFRKLIKVSSLEDLLRLGLL